MLIIIQPWLESLSFSCLFSDLVTLPRVDDYYSKDLKMKL